MKSTVVTGLPEDGSPLEWATIGHGTLYTSQAPIRPDGSIEDGPMSAQAAQTFANLAQTLRAAGGTVDDVTQVIVYLTDKGDFPEMNAAYKAAFARPYPNRATIIVSDLMVPGARVEVIAYAAIAS